jgi:hypothetical protein
MDELLAKESQQSYEITELQNQGGALAQLARAEIDIQISTAHAYPRSLERFRTKAMTMLMMNQEIADECFYVLPRAGKTIEGPSVRLAEIVAASYGNMRSGARIVAEEAEFVIAQGVCHDLENNLAVTFEVKRRITDKNNERFNTDMIGVTGNAAASIAFRNTVFRVVPKVLWLPLYEQARRVAKGDEKTFSVKREGVLQAFEKIKVPRKKIFEYLGIAGLEDMNSDHLVTLIGIGNAIKSGETTVGEAFGEANDLKQAKRKSETKVPEASGTNDAQKPPTSAPNANNVASEAECKEFYRACMFELGMAQVDIKKWVREHYQLDSVKGCTKETLSSILGDLVKEKKG